MTRAKRNRALYAAAVGSLALWAVPAVSESATLTWDANGLAPVGGEGVWDTSAANWTPDNGTSYTLWSNATPDAAVFSGATSNVTLAAAMTAASLSMGVNSVTLELDGFNLTVNGSIGGLQVTNSTIRNSNTLTTATLTASGPGTTINNVRGNINLILNGSATSGGTNDFTGSYLFKPTAASSNLTVSSHNHLGSANTTLTLDSTDFRAGLVLGAAAGKVQTYNRDMVLISSSSGAQASVLNPNGPLEAVIAGSISGGTTIAGGVGLQVHGAGSAQGSLVLAGNNSYSGLTLLSAQQSTLTLAHNNALGNSSGISLSSSATAASIGFSGGITLANTNTIDIRRASAAPSTGHATIHNWSGNNTVSNNIFWDSATGKLFGAEAGTTLTLLGTVGHATSQMGGIIKIGHGTVAMSAPTRAGTNNGGQQGNAIDVREGTLHLNFSAGNWETSPGVMRNMINNNWGTDATTATSIAQLFLTSGTLQITGKSGVVIEQYFRNETGDTAPINGGNNAFQVRQGASAIRVNQNGATAVTVGTGKLLESLRSVGGTIDFTLPTTGSIIMQGTGTAGGASSVGSSNTILSANGAAFATVDHLEWAAMGTSRNIVKGSDIAGFYTANAADSLSGNADMSSGFDTQLAGTANLSSLRFHNSGTRSIDLNGQTMSTGGILITNEGNGAVNISNGTLRGNTSTSGNLQDLVIYQHETSAAATIGATITNNTNATGLTKNGAGTLILTAANNYTGETHINGGVLRITGSGAIGTGKLVMQGGILGIDTGTSFTRTIGIAAGNVEFAGIGGFAAYGTGSATVNLGGAGADFHIGGGSFHTKYGNALVLGAADATGTIIIANPLRLGAENHPVIHEIRVINGAADVDAQISFQASAARDGGWRKTGAGTVLLAGTSTSNSHNGATIIEEGIVRLGHSSSLPNRELTIKAGTLDLGAFNHTASSTSITFGGGASGTTANVTGTGTFTVGTDVSYVGSVDSGATISSLVSLSAVRTFNVANSTGTTTEMELSNVVSGAGGITKTGVGTLRLSSSSNGYTGATNINGGALLLTGNIAGSAITVNNTGTLDLATTGSISSNSTLTVNSGGTLKGLGSIARPTTINAGGTIAPGAGVGNLNTAGLTMQAGSIYSAEIDFGLAGGTGDRIIVSGTAALNGAILELEFINSDQFAGAAKTYTLIDSTGAIDFNTAFASIISDAGDALQYDLSNGDGTDYIITINAVPEPGSLGLVAAGAGLLLRRRRRG